MITKKGTCHCKKVEFQITLEGEFKDVRRCNCSLCRRKGAVISSVPLSNLKVTNGAENLTLYQWNTKTAKHYFCKTCGIYTHHQRRSNPSLYGFNIACIEGVNPYEFDVGIGDGASQTLVE